MSVWVLVIVLSTMTGAAIDHVEGFPTEASCERAAVKLNASRAAAICVEMPMTEAQ